MFAPSCERIMSGAPPRVMTMKIMFAVCAVVRGDTMNLNPERDAMKALFYAQTSAIRFSFTGRIARKRKRNSLHYKDH